MAPHILVPWHAVEFERICPAASVGQRGFRGHAQDGMVARACTRAGEAITDIASIAAAAAVDAGGVLAAFGRRSHLPVMSHRFDAGSLIRYISGCIKVPACSVQQHPYEGFREK